MKTKTNWGKLCSKKKTGTSFLYYDGSYAISGPCFMPCLSLHATKSICKRKPGGTTFQDNKYCNYHYWYREPNFYNSQKILASQNKFRNAVKTWQGFSGEKKQKWNLWLKRHRKDLNRCMSAYNFYIGLYMIDKVDKFEGRVEVEEL